MGRRDRSQRTWYAPWRLFVLFLASLTTPAPAIADTRLGQWVWSRSDLVVLGRVRQQRPEIGAAVSIAELDWDGQVRVALRLPPGVAGTPELLVVRLGDSFHRAPAERAGAEVDQALARLLAAAGPAFTTTPIEIDYDAPVSRLPLYADWLRGWRAGSLAGRQLWITTLIAHQRDPGFSARVAPLVDGHVLQVFDTGEPWTPQGEDELIALLARTRLPFALGLGAFDRDGTDHAAWLRVVPRLRTLPDYRGVWVFPAGFDWTPMLRRLP